MGVEKNNKPPSTLLFQSVDPNHREWLRKELLENNCQIKKESWKSVDSEYETSIEPTFKGRYVLNLLASSEDKSNLTFVQKRFKNLMENISLLDKCYNL